jgi:hypothetical protein
VTSHDAVGHPPSEYLTHTTQLMKLIPSLTFRITIPPNSHPNPRSISTHSYPAHYLQPHDVCIFYPRRSKQEKDSQIRAMRARAQRGVSLWFYFVQRQTDTRCSCSARTRKSFWRPSRLNERMVLVTRTVLLCSHHFKDITVVSTWILNM